MSWRVRCGSKKFLRRLAEGEIQFRFRQRIASQRIEWMGDCSRRKGKWKGEERRRLKRPRKDSGWPIRPARIVSERVSPASSSYGDAISIKAILLLRAPSGLLRVRRPSVIVTCTVPSNPTFRFVSRTANRQYAFDIGAIYAVHALRIAYDHAHRIRPVGTLNSQQVCWPASRHLVGTGDRLTWSK